MNKLDPRKIYNLELPRKKFKFLNAEEVVALPGMSWLVDGIFPSSGTACIYGPSGVGKSFLSIHLAASVAEGRDWFGHKTLRGNVAYLALEGQGGITKRLQAWAAHNGRPYPKNVHFCYMDFDITTLTEPADLIEDLKEKGGASLVIVDTLSRAMPGADENGSLSMGQAIAGAAILQAGTEGLVILNHHPGKDISKKLRGHSSLHAALDTILEVKEEGGSAVWRTLKSKDGEANVRHGFKLDSIEFTDHFGSSLTSCVVTENHGGASLERAVPKGANQIEVDRAVSKILFDQRVAAVAEGHLDGPALGVPLEAVREAIAGLLVSVEAKRRRERAKDALDALIAKGRFILTDEILTLAPQGSQMGGE